MPQAHLGHGAVLPMLLPVRYRLRWGATSVVVPHLRSLSILVPIMSDGFIGGRRVALCCYPLLAFVGNDGSHSSRLRRRSAGVLHIARLASVWPTSKLLHAGKACPTLSIPSDLVSTALGGLCGRYRTSLMFLVIASESCMTIFGREDRSVSLGCVWGLLCRFSNRER